MRPSDEYGLRRLSPSMLGVCDSHFAVRATSTVRVRYRRRRRRSVRRVASDPTLGRRCLVEHAALSVAECSPLAPTRWGRDSILVSTSGSQFTLQECEAQESTAVGAAAPHRRRPLSRVAHAFAHGLRATTFLHSAGNFIRLFRYFDSLYSSTVVLQFFHHFR